jgi:hypothetical protein
LAPVAWAVAATPVAPANSIGVQLVDLPANSRGRSYIVARAAPGTRIRRRIEITNTTASTTTVAVYPAAASVLDGKFSFAAAHLGNELSGWTSVSDGTLRVPTAGSAFETVTIAIPRKAAFGDRYGVVWAEVSAQTAAGGGLNLVNRVGIRMYIAVGPRGAPASFVIGTLSAERSATGVPLVVAMVRNIGRRTLDIGGTLMLSDGPGGRRAGPFPVTLGTGLGAGQSGTATVRLDSGLPSGPWQADLHLRSGFTEREAVARLTFPELVAASSGSRRLLLLVALVLALVAAVVALSLNRRQA